jgi:Domain of unknown function (DUF1844)
MSEEQPSLQIDTDWKRQAQEEKKRLAEQQREREQQQQQRAQSAAAAAAAPAGIPPVGDLSGIAPGPAATATTGAVATPAGTGSTRADARGRRELPPASFATLVQSLMTQAMLYLGEVPTSSGPVLNLDMAKHQIDLLTLLEEKTRNNLTEEEQRLLDTVLYQLRMRFVDVASQML